MVGRDEREGMSETSDHLLYRVEIFHNRATHQFLIEAQDVPRGGEKVTYCTKSVCQSASPANF